MSQQISDGIENGSGPDFNLPDEILLVIPTDPYEQLDLARKITSMAIASRVNNLEMETARLRQTLSDKDRLIGELADRLSHLEQLNQEAESRLKLALQDNIKLSKERDSLAATAKKLTRDLSKLETFKRQLMQSLNEDDSSQAETVDIRTCDQPVPKAYPDKEHEINDYKSGSLRETGNVIDDAPKQAGQRFSSSSYLTPRLTPTGTPKIISTSGSPRKYSSATSPQKASGSMSPSKGQYDGAALASWYPPSQQSSAANSPPRGRSLPGRTPRIDGKEFFRQARSRLSYEQFSAFLANVKELNARKQSREETLRKAQEIFGIDNKDLYLSFQGLLNRNIR